MKLWDIAHSRTGDKGDISNISLIPYDERDYRILKKYITADLVRDFFSEICRGNVTRYELDGIKSLNFVLDKALGGGVTRSIALDKHGKSLGMALLEMEITDEMAEELPSVKHEAVYSNRTDYVPEGRVIRIGCGAGYSGDRIEPAEELMTKGNLDYIVFECLAERTIAIGQKAKQEDPGKGYNSLLEYRMRKILPLAAENNIRIITNMGAANPEAAARATAEIARETGCGNLKIVYVTGDDIYGSIEQYMDCIVLESGRPLSEYESGIVSANAYLGAEGIVKALECGADVIITGRVADPALIVGPLVYEFGWNITDDPDKMGTAILAGHLLECAGQVTGGYFADPGHKSVPGLERLGFPIAEVYESGELVITKVQESGGVVDTDTCKEQLVYEIHDPGQYKTPDGIADFSAVRFMQIADDRVLASGAASNGIPDQLKVSIGYKDCFIGEGEISYGGSTAMERAHIAADIVKKRIDITEIAVQELRVDLVGYDSLYMGAISSEIAENKPPEIRLRISGRTADRENARRIVNEMETLYTNGPAGGGGYAGKVTEVLSVCSIFIPRGNCSQEIHNMN